MPISLTLPQPCKTAAMEESLSHQLVTEGYCLAHFTPPVPDLVSKVIAGFNDFLTELPLSERLRWMVGDPEDFDDGYIARSDDYGRPLSLPGQGQSYGGGKFDNKVFFHYRPHLTSLLDHYGVDYTRWKDWLSAMDELYRYSFLRYLEMLEEVRREIELPPGMSSFLHSASHPFTQQKTVLRLLSYKGCMQPGLELAKPHPDKCFATWHVWESHPGLILHSKTGKVIHHKHQDGKALFFTGAKAKRISAGLLSPIVHEVRVPEDYEGFQDETRQSIVFFGHVMVPKD